MPPDILSFHNRAKRANTPFAFFKTSFGSGLGGPEKPCPFAYPLSQAQSGLAFKACTATETGLFQISPLPLFSFNSWLS